MSDTERYGTRDLTYSAWHRTGPVSRYVGLEKAQLMAMIDIDAAAWVEYRDRDKVPLVLIEAAKDIGQDHKTATVISRLAQLASLPAFIVLYKHATTANPFNPQYADIAEFRVKQIQPEHSRNATWQLMTPKQWCERLLQIRGIQAKKFDDERLKAWNEFVAKSLPQLDRPPTYLSPTDAFEQYKRELRVSVKPRDVYDTWFGPKSLYAFDSELNNLGYELFVQAENQTRGLSHQ